MVFHQKWLSIFISFSDAYTMNIITSITVSTIGGNWPSFWTERFNGGLMKKGQN